MSAIRGLPCLLLLGAAAAAMAQTTHAPIGAAEPANATPAQIFSDNCAACHQEDGKGIEGAFPALAGDPFVLGDGRQVIHVVLEGRGGMPTFKADLTSPPRSPMSAPAGATPPPP
jgi:cytochrome c6